jgi:hypothetical protein
MFVGFIMPGRAVMEGAYDVPTRLGDRIAGCSDNCGRTAVGGIFSGSTSARDHRDFIAFPKDKPAAAEDKPAAAAEDKPAAAAEDKPAAAGAAAAGAAAGAAAAATYPCPRASVQGRRKRGWAGPAHA